jgi:hypothetical protein
LGAPDFPTGGFPLPTTGEPEAVLTEDIVRDELRFLDDPAAETPASLPQTSLWLGKAWQHHVLDEEMDVLAESVTDTQPGMPADWSPATSRAWALKVQSAWREAKYALLDEDPIADETFGSDKNSPLMARTVSKAAAGAAGAAGSIRQLPGVAKAPVSTLRTLTLGGYRVVTLTRGVARLSIIAGAVMLVIGVAAAVQSATIFGVTGLILASIGGYLIALGTWQFSSRLLFALISLTIVGAVLALATPVVRHWLFGTEKAPGLVGANAYWVGAEWWHPLIIVGALVLAIAALSSARPHR